MHGYRQYDNVVVGLTSIPEYVTSWGGVKGLGGVDNTQLSAYCQVTLLASLGVACLAILLTTASCSHLSPYSWSPRSSECATTVTLQRCSPAKAAQPVTYFDADHINMTAAPLT